MPDSFQKQIDDRITQVRLAHRQAIGELESKWWRGATEDKWLDALRSLTGRIDAWAQNGNEGAPGKAGWPGWLKSGQILLDGVASMMAGSALDVRQRKLALITDIPRHAPKDVARAAKKSAKVATKVAASAAKATGEIAAAGVAPLLLPLLAIGGVGLVAYMALGRR